MNRRVAMLAALTVLAFSAVASAQTPVTFAKDVAPIVYAKCGVCHHPGGSAPFSLLTYATARAHATQIADVTRSGFMPPWKADADYGGDFVGQPRLTPRRARRPATMGRDGRPGRRPRANRLRRRRWTEGWQLGKPDLVVTPPRRTRCRPTAPTSSACS